MDRLLSIIQRLAIVAIWLVASGIISVGIAAFANYENEGAIELGFCLSVGGVLFGYVGTKLVKWIFNTTAH